MLTRILVAGGLAGLLDITYAITAHATRGVAPHRILQSVATGIWGKDAYAGGWLMALYGTLLHFFMAGLMAAAFVLAYDRLEIVRRMPLASGAVYGLGLYFVMNYIVVPLSASPGQPPQGWYLLGALFAHICLVGMTISHVASGHLVPAAVRQTAE